MLTNNGRVQTPGLDGVRQPLRPAGLPGSAIVRVPDVPRTNSLLQIAEALSNVNAGLGSYAARLRRDEEVAKNDPDKNGTNQAQIDYAELGPEEFGRRLKNGEIPDSQRRAYETVGGFNEASKFQGELANAYDSDFDKDKGDIVDWTRQYRAAKLARFTDPAAKIAFIKATGPMLDQLITGHQKYLSERLGQERVAGVSSNYDLIVQEAKRKGWTPKQLQSNIEAAGSAAKAKGSLNLTGEENDTVLFNLAQKYAAQGDTTTTEALLNSAREGRGSLLQDGSHGAKAYKVLEEAYSAARKKAVDADPLAKGSLLSRVRDGEATDDEIANSPYLTGEEKASWKAASDQAKATIIEQARKRIAKAAALETYEKLRRSDAVEAHAMVMAKNRPQGVFFSDRQDFPTKDGEGMEVFSADDRMKGLVAYHEDHVQEELQRRRDAGWNEGDLANFELDQHIKFYSRTGQVRKEWQQLLSGTAISVPEIIAAKGQVPPSAEHAARLYQALRSNNSVLLDRLVKDDASKLFFETFNRSTTIAQMPAQAAFARAAEIVGKRARGELPKFSARDEDIDRAVKSAGFEEVTGDARLAVYNMAEMLTQSGSPVDEALEQAAAIVGKRYTPINGRPVFTGDVSIPSGFAEAAEIKLEALVDQYGKQAELDDEDDLYLAPVADRTDVWRVMRKDGLGDFLDDKGRVVTIDLPEVKRVIAMQADIEHWQDVDAFNKSRVVSPLSGGMLITPSIDIPFAIMKFFGERHNALQKDNMIRDREGGYVPPDTRDPANFPGVPGVGERPKREGPTNWPGVTPPTGADILGLNDEDQAVARKVSSIYGGPKKPTGDLRERMKYGMTFFTDRGYSTAQAAGIVGNLVQESSLNPHVRPGDNGTAHGIAQWRHERLARLKAFARTQGTSWRDFDTQLSFIDYELRNHETFAYRKLLAATTVDEATAAMISYERPQGWTTQRPRRGHGWNNRRAYAQDAFQLLASL